VPGGARGAGLTLRQDGRVDRLHDPDRRDFGSDNYAGVHPEILAALAAANDAHPASLPGVVELQNPG